MCDTWRSCNDQTQGHLTLETHPGGKLLIIYDEYTVVPLFVVDFDHCWAS